LTHGRQNDYERASSLRGGYVFVTMGHPIDGVALHRALHILTERRNPQFSGVTIAFLAERSIWRGDLIKARALADRAWELASHQRYERDFIHAALLQGRVALGLSNLTQADERLHHALTRTRAVNMVEYELPALIAIAELKLAQGRVAEARGSLDEVWEAAERGPYPLYQADAYNVLADIELGEDNKRAAIAAATKAFRAARCDGPPYAYHWGLEKAKAHLRALGAPEPKMPPFDESKFEPMPEVDINPKDEHWVDPKSVD
jgi:ATP/maltotriose-dependent transcriptional regulator MalT